MLPPPLPLPFPDLAPFLCPPALPLNPATFNLDFSKMTKLFSRKKVTPEGIFGVREEESRREEKDTSSASARN